MERQLQVAVDSCSDTKLAEVGASGVAYQFCLMPLHIAYPIHKYYNLSWHYMGILVLIWFNLIVCLIPNYFRLLGLPGI